MKVLFMFILLSGLVASCSDKENSLGPSPVVTQEQAASQREFREFYSFSINGCDTGEHEFIASSEKEVREMLCEALKDHEFNQFCAEEARKKYYSEKC